SRGCDTRSVAAASLYINAYAPLAIRPAGRQASERFGIAPFVDGSIRREPDLEHERPSISCLCRGGLFAPRLRPGDVVIYMTKKSRFGAGERHRRMTAVLEVDRLFYIHRDAAEWYRSNSMPLPCNCMVEGNPPNHVSRSHRGYENSLIKVDDVFTCKWEIGYRKRARDTARFVVCKPLWRELSWTAPRVTHLDLEAVFGRVPPTRNP